jgi:glutamate dehydrogenase
MLPGEFAALVSARARQWEEAGVPAALAARLAALPALLAALDIHLVAEATARPAAAIAPTHFAIAARLHVGEIATAAAALRSADHLDEVARDRALDSLAAIHRRITASVMAVDGEDALDAWLAANGTAVESTAAAIAGIIGGGPPSLARITVAADLLGGLVRG